MKRLKAESEMTSGLIKQLKDYLDEKNNQLDAKNVQLDAMTKKLIDEQERHLCKLCFDSAIDTVYVPCGHKAVCFKCSE